MGTRSLTIFVDDLGEEIAVLYRQYDGYLEGHGVELANALAGYRMVNGIGDRNAKEFNGAHDLAVRVIAKLKGDADVAGEFYLHAAGSRNLGEEFVYTVRPGNPDRLDTVAGVTISVASVYENRSDNNLTPEQFLELVASRK